MIWFILLFLFIPFVWVVFIGAPYVPAHKKAIIDATKIVDQLGLSKQGRLVEFGCGDGRFLLEVSKKGYKSTGYEFNPFLVLVANFRLRKYKNIEIKCANIWSVDLPDDTEIVYTFLLDKFMSKLDKKMKKESRRLNKNLILISYVFKISNKKPIKEVGGVRVYEYPCK